MFENTKRSIAAIKKIRANSKKHKARMRMIKQNEKFALEAIDRTFAEIKSKIL